MSLLRTQLDKEFLVVRFGVCPPPSTSDDEAEDSLRNVVYEVHLRTDELPKSICT